jgi:peptide/nickel transport system permease protein
LRHIEFQQKARRHRPGTGFLLNAAIFQRDLPLLQGTILVLAMFFVMLNLLVDVLQTTLDPRIQRT